MDLKLRGKTALVTGSSAGIGEAIAMELASEGVRVLVHGRDADRTEAVADAIRGGGGDAAAVTADLGDTVDVETLAGWALERGPVDILVHNAGGRVIRGPSSLFDVDVDKWSRTFQLNVFAAAHLSSRLVPGMVARGWGRVIQISSIGAILTRPDTTEYGASKAAAISMTLGLSKALAGSGVTANSICPGAVTSPAFREVLQLQAAANGWTGSPDEIVRAAVMDRWPNACERFGEVEEIASAVVWLASPRNGFVTGATIRVDGGRTGTTH